MYFHNETEGIKDSLFQGDCVNTEFKVNSNGILFSKLIMISQGYAVYSKKMKNKSTDYISVVNFSKKSSTHDRQAKIWQNLT